MLLSLGVPSAALLGRTIVSVVALVIFEHKVIESPRWQDMRKWAWVRVMLNATKTRQLTDDLLLLPLRRYLGSLGVRALGSRLVLAGSLALDGWRRCYASTLNWHDIGRRV